MGDNAECVAEFVSKTAADSSVAQVLLKITENSVDDAVQLFHSISDEKVSSNTLEIIPIVSLFL